MIQGPLTAIVISALTPFILEKLKGVRRFPLMQRYAPRLNRIVPIVVAAATALGITWKFTLLQGGGWVATIAGPSLTDMISFGLIWALSAGVQQGIYRTAIDPKP